MKGCVGLILLSASVVGILSEKRSHNEPHWLDECWDHGHGHVVNPLCELLTKPTTTTTTTPTTTTTTEPTTTTTEPTTTTTEPTTTTTEPTTTTTEPTTTTTTPAPTTTPRTCDYITFNDSNVASTDFGTDMRVPGNNASRPLNDSVHVNDNLEACKSTCIHSLLQDNFECWAFTFDPVVKCYLYYYSRPLQYIPKNINANGTTLFLKRCSDNPFANITLSTAPFQQQTSPTTPTSTKSVTDSQMTVTTQTPPVNTGTTQSLVDTGATVSTGATGPVDTGATPVVTGATSAPINTGTGQTTGSTVAVTDSTTTGISTPSTSIATAPVVTPSPSAGTAAPVVTGSSSTSVPVRSSSGPSLVTGVTPVNTGGSGTFGVPGGIVQINSNTFRINGVPSPQPNTCYFHNSTFALGDSWMDTCRYNCSCVDTNRNFANCRDVCPLYRTIPSNCNLVRKPGDCCQSLNCTGPVVTTPAPGNGSACFDKNDSCAYYPDSACRQPYVPWARNNCPLRCDFCPGRALPCINEITYCDRYDLDYACQAYEGWARKNCRLACSRCNVPGWNPDGVNVPATTLPPPPTSS